MSLGAESGIENNEHAYLLDKIANADFETEPFKHLEIKNFLKEEHFNHITRLPEISTSGRSDKELIDSMKMNGYKIISFPGTFNSAEEYISYREGNKFNRAFSRPTDSQGLVLRLSEYDDPLLNQLFDLFRSREFIDCVCDKFELNSEEFNSDITKGEKKTEGLDVGLQKYLDGYEISPHPDIRKKALTWMLNVNPSSKSKDLNHHTHYMEFKDEKKYILDFWKYNTSYDRCWVPWEWCNTIKQQVENNSIVFFSPSYDALHAVKAEYNHLETQRTQFYGNLWYQNIDTKGKPEWDDLMIKPKGEHEIMNRGKIRNIYNNAQSKKSFIKKGVQNPFSAVKKILK